jgi:hypothetical protein
MRRSASRDKLRHVGQFHQYMFKRSRESAKRERPSGSVQTFFTALTGVITFGAGA